MTNDEYCSLIADELCLSHHGIEGQKWGVQNGPPYPLDKQTNRRIRKINRIAYKAEKKGDIAKAAAIRANTMSNEELAKNIARTQAQITYIRAVEELNRTYIENEKEYDKLTNTSKYERLKKKDEKEKFKRELKLTKEKSKINVKENKQRTKDQQEIIRQNANKNKRSLKDTAINILSSCATDIAKDVVKDVATTAIAPTKASLINKTKKAVEQKDDEKK